MALPFAVEFSTHHYDYICFGMWVPSTSKSVTRKEAPTVSLLHILLSHPPPPLKWLMQISLLVTTVPSILVSSWTLKVPGTPSSLWVDRTILLSLVPAHS